MKLIHGTSPQSALNIAIEGFAAPENGDPVYFFEDSIDKDSPYDNECLQAAIQEHGAHHLSPIGGKFITGLVMADIADSLYENGTDGVGRDIITVGASHVGDINVRSIRFYDLDAMKLVPIVSMRVSKKGITTGKGKAVSTWMDCKSVIEEALSNN